MKALVTGVAGFIGSHLAERLIREGYQVIGVDCFTDYYPRWMKERNLENLRQHERFTFVETDLLDLDLVVLLRDGEVVKQGEDRCTLHTLAPVQLVFHLAAQAGVRSSWGCNFEMYTRNNILATQRLLEAAKEVTLDKFVYASSSSVYGDAETFPTSEDVTPRPISPYGVTKLAGEHLCLLYWRNYGVPVVCLRYFTVYGPRQRPDMAFHRFIRAVLKGQEVMIYGDGEQTRDFTYVDDATEGTLRAAVADVAGEVFNIGGGSQVMVNQVINLLEAVLNRPAHVRRVEPQHGDVRHTSADIARATTLLGYTPQWDLQSGLQAQATWMQSGLSEAATPGVLER